MNTAQVFAERLKELRTSKSIAQDKLAEDLSLSKSSVSFWERGINIPRLDIAAAIAEYFGVSLDYLAGLIDS